MWKVYPKTFVAFCVFMMALTVPAAEGKLITVDDDAPANYSIIQDAINFASDGDEIEVRPGTYNEAINFNGKAIRLYSSGGPQVTIIDANGGAYHVVQCVSGEDANTILEGFNITGGDATGTGSNSRGGGMYCESSSPMVINCAFTDNAAFDGGGVFNLLADTRLTGCIFFSNSASGESGGLHNHDCNAIVTNCTFESNTSIDGSAMTNAYGSPTVTSCTFSENVASGSGGGMYNRSGSTPTVSYCTFDQNYASVSGGGMFNDSSSPTVTNCTFFRNDADFSGSGMYNLNSNPKVTNCTFSYNDYVYDGGGIYNSASSPTVTNCTFGGNIANSGGGMYNLNSNPKVTNCTFSYSDFVYDGGGIYNSASSPTVTNCTFSGILASNNGGGIYNSASSPTVTNCTFSGNDTELSGGGMFNVDNSNPVVSECTFNSNEAGWGGGMCNDNSSPYVSNCSFSGNNSVGGDGGGGMMNYISSATMANCVFLNNYTDQVGGGMLNVAGSLTMINCTFSGNSAVKYGGGLFNDWDSYPTLTNCILWADEPNEIGNDHSSNTYVNYSDVQGDWYGFGNIDADPCFVDVDNPDPNLWSLRLKPDSLCIDAGDTTAVPGGIWTDLGGNPRVLDDPQISDTGVSLSSLTVDMGAYEFLPCSIPGDINCDGVVDFKDVAILCGNWLVGTEPEL